MAVTHDSSTLSLAKIEMTEITLLVEDDPEGGYVARAIGESIFNQADTIAELKTLVRDAVQFVGWVELGETQH